MAKFKADKMQKIRLQLLRGCQATGGEKDPLNAA